MEYIVGNKQDFFSFIDSISKEDNIGIITHTDLDGFASAIFLEEILSTKGIEISHISFLNYKKNMFNKIEGELKQKQITKIFILDIGADSEKESLEDLRKKFEVFFIDHHPFNEEIDNRKNIIKTHSHNCAAMIMHDLGKEFFEIEKWKWLISATMISEWSHRNEENLSLLKEWYPEIEEKEITQTYPAEIAKKINSAIIFHETDLKKIYEIVKKQDIYKIEEVHEIIIKEIEKEMKEFETKAEYISEKNLYIYKIKSKYPIASTIGTSLARKNHDKVYLIITEREEIIKISARNQGTGKNMNKLLKKGITGIENSMAGGHHFASAAKIPKKEWTTFKKNILEFA